MPDQDVMARDDLIAEVLKVMRALSPDELPPSQEDSVRAMLMAYVPRPRQGDLFLEPPREGNRLVNAAMAMLHGGSDRHEPSLGLAVKVAITIGNLRAGRWDRLHASEALTVARTLAMKLPEGAVGGTPRVEAIDGPSGGPVEFMFPWRAGNARAGTSTCQVDLVETEPVDAPVACSLWTPGARLVLRRLGAEWLRPVLSPGSWRPVTVPEFREAARSGCAWPDNPFQPPPRRGLPAFHVLDLAGPQPLTAANARRMSEARDACLVSAGQLHVVDGVVHRVTGSPVAGFGTVLSRGGTVTGPAWRIDGLGSTCGMETFGEAPVATWFNGVPSPDRSGSVDPDGGFVALSDWFGVSRVLGDRVRRTGGVPVPRSPSARDLAWSWEPPPSGADIHECLRVAAGVATRLLPVAHVYESLRGPLATCVRLKETLIASQARLDAGQDVEAAEWNLIGGLCAEVLDMRWPVADPRAGMWDYVAALASHAADHGVRPHDEDPELLEVQL